MGRMVNAQERLDSIPDYNNAVEYYLAGSSPTRVPKRAMRDFLRVQEYLIRPESTLSIDTIRLYRQQNRISPSLFGPAFGLGGLMAFTRSDIDHRGIGLELPKIAGIYNCEQTKITPLPDPEKIRQQLTQFFLDSDKYPELLKKLIQTQGGFQVV